MHPKLVRSREREPLAAERDTRIVRRTWRLRTSGRDSANKGFLAWLDNTSDALSRVDQSRYSGWVTPFFSAGQFAYGFIAVGQVAVGVIAIGQLATGAIAIGQLARGGIAIGMVAIGIIAIGGLSVGVVYTGGVGIGGRRLFGLVLELMPMPDKPRQYPRTSSVEHLARPGARAWLPVRLSLTSTGVVHFHHEGQALEVRVAAGLAQAAQRFASLQGRGLALIARQPGGAGLICERIIGHHRPKHRKPAFWLLAALRLAVLAGLSYLIWRFAVLPIGGGL